MIEAPCGSRMGLQCMFWDDEARGKVFQGLLEVLDRTLRRVAWARMHIPRSCVYCWPEKRFVYDRGQITDSHVDGLGSPIEYRSFKDVDWPIGELRITACASELAVQGCSCFTALGHDA